MPIKRGVLLSGEACILTSIQLCSQINTVESDSEISIEDKVGVSSKEIRAYKRILHDSKLNDTEKTDSLIACIQKFYQRDPWSAEFLSQSLYDYSLEKKNRCIVLPIQPFARLPSF